MSVVELFSSGGPWAAAFAVGFAGNQIRVLTKMVADHERRLRKGGL